MVFTSKIKMEKEEEMQILYKFFIDIKFEMHTYYLENQTFLWHSQKKAHNRKSNFLFSISEGENIFFEIKFEKNYFLLFHSILFLFVK